MARKSRTEGSTNWVILLTDDDPDYAQSTQKLLEREGHRVLLAQNGVTALRILREEHVDLLLLDYFMPGITGEQVVGELRKFNPYVQVILQTGYASEQPPRDMLRRLDIQGYHDKSEGPDKLLLWTDIGLKAAQTVQLLYKSRQSMRLMLNATFELHKMQALDALLQTILSQVTAMVGCKDSFLATTREAAADRELDFSIQASTGQFVGRHSVSECLHADARAQIAEAIAQSAVRVVGGATVVPLSTGVDLLGFLYVDRPLREESDLELLGIFTRQAAVAIQKAKLYESAQEQVIQSEKLASIGQLAAGVAHEINNPIGYVCSNFGTLEEYHESIFQMLNAYQDAQKATQSEDAFAVLSAMRERLELDFLLQDIPQLMSESKEGLSRVQKIVQDLKCFSRIDGHQEWQIADLHQGIDSTLNIVNNEVKYIADVVKEYGDIPKVECLPSQINQVVMNLVVNAAHAMSGERGTITIRTGRQGDDEVWFEVQDTGAGIPKENLLRIFDPFFTTKPVGKGTGLGLSLSYGIVQKHNGRIDVRSEQGVGTVFRVMLPVQQPNSGDAS